VRYLGKEISESALNKPDTKQTETKLSEPAKSHTMEIKYINVWSLAKFQGIVMTIVGLVMSILYWILTMSISTLTDTISKKTSDYINSTAGAAVSSGIGPVIPTIALPSSPAILLGIICIMAIFGLVSGAIVAVFYNALSFVIGGIKIELR
jgi:hypothetical protein